VPLRTKSILLPRASRPVLGPSGFRWLTSVFLGCGVSLLGAGARRYDVARWSNRQGSKCSCIGSFVQKWQHENEHLNSVKTWSVWGSGRLSTRTPRLFVSWCRTWQDIAARPTSLCSSGCACCTFRPVRPQWPIYVPTVSSAQHFQFTGSLDRVFWVTVTADSDNFCTQHEPASRSS